MEFIIGKKYEREFRYAFLLIKGCDALRSDYWTEGDIKDGDRPVYDDPVIYVKSGGGYHSYRYDEDVANARFAGESDGDGSVTQGFTAQGATWFAGLRGDASAVSPDANWQNLMFQVAEAYHKQYSVLEYKQQENDGIDEKQAREIVANFLELFHRDFSVAEKRPSLRVEATRGKESEMETQDVYGLSLRLALNGGGGHSEFVIGKVFFEKSAVGSKMKPMPRAEARRMDELLMSFETSSKGNADGLGADENETSEEAARRLENLKESALNGLQDCVPNDRENNFLDYLFMDDPRDIEKVQALLSRTTDSTYELQCDEVKVLCISHLQWKSAAYDVYVNNRRAFRFTFDLNNSMTVKCLNCGSVKDGEQDYEVLVEKNEVRMLADESKKLPVKIDSVFLKNIKDKKFGLTDKEIGTVREHSAFKKHAKVRGCSFVGKKCVDAVRCDSQVESVVDKATGKTFSYCKNCHYPEKVYFDPQASDGKGVNIPAFRIALDVNTMRPVDKSAAKTCKCCGRTFTAKTSKTCCNLCGMSNMAVDGNLNEDQTLEATALYKEYAYILPVAVRMFAAFKKKYCFEDDCMILFVVGSKKYYFDKLEVKNTGVIKAARKMQ